MLNLLFGLGYGLCQEHATIHSYSGIAISLHVWRIYIRKARKEGDIVIWTVYEYD